MASFYFVLTSLFSGLITLKGNETKLYLIFFLLLGCSSFLFVNVKMNRFSHFRFFFIDLSVRVVFLASIHFMSLKWPLEKPFWYPDTKDFWAQAISINKANNVFELIERFFAGDRNAIITNHLWALGIRIFGDTPLVIPLFNAMYISIAASVLRATLFLVKEEKEFQRFLLTLFCISPFSFHVMFWGQKDALVCCLLSIATYFLMRLLLGRNIWPSIFGLISTVLVFWFERPYISIFLIVATIWILFFPNFSENLPLKVSVKALFASAGIFLVFLFFNRELLYFSGTLFSLETVELGSWTSDAPFHVKLFRLMITPLPFKISDSYEINYLLSFHFLTNLIIHGLLIWAVIQSAIRFPKILGIVMPYLIFLLAWAVFYPGYNRVRDPFIPMILSFVFITYVLSSKRVTQTATQTKLEGF